MPIILPIPTIDNQLAEIPGGTTELNDDRTKHKWTVDIKPFLMAKLPVTQDIYFEITKTNPSTFKGDKLPVESVTWKEAAIFCNLLSIREGIEPCYLFTEDTEEKIFAPQANGFRMPTEAEWQYACKSGTNTIRYGDLDRIAWYKNNSGKRTHEVGQKDPNNWGLYDMLGNVWEWCSDIYDQDVYGSYRIFKGGGWADEKRSVMATTRRRSHPDKFRIDDLGFRIVRNNYNL